MDARTLLSFAAFQMSASYDRRLRAVYDAFDGANYKVRDRRPLQAGLFEARIKTREREKKCIFYVSMRAAGAAESRRRRRFFPASAHRKEVEYANG